MEPEFLELMSQVIRVRQAIGRDAYGEESFSETFVEVPAHLESRSQAVATVAGETVWVSGQAFIPVTPGLDTSDLFLIQQYDQPDNWEEIDVQAIRVEYDENGPHHMVLFYGVK